LVDATLTEVRERGATTQEIDRARRKLSVRTLNGLQDLESRASRMQLYVSAGKPADWLDEDLARYDRVTPGTIARVLAEPLAHERRTVVLVRPMRPIEGA
jgi:predicted Zn-dependent peptidase